MQAFPLFSRSAPLGASTLVPSPRFFAMGELFFPAAGRERHYKLYASFSHLVMALHSNWYFIRSMRPDDNGNPGPRPATIQCCFMPQLDSPRMIRGKYRIGCENVFDIRSAKYCRPTGTRGPGMMLLIPSDLYSCNGYIGEEYGVTTQQVSTPATVSSHCA